jgi:hypothetical protein
MISGIINGMGRLLPAIGNLVTSHTQSLANESGIAFQSLGDSITRPYGERDRKKSARRMIGGAIASYGEALQNSVRRGGMMATFASEIWERLGEGMENYAIDMEMISRNASMRNATFAAQRGANRLVFLSKLATNILETYNEISRHQAIAPGQPFGFPKVTTKEERVRW